MKVLHLGIDIPIADLHPHPLNESLYGVDIDEAFVQSLQDSGLLQPIVVSLRPDGSHRIVSGERRTIGWSALGNEHIRADIREYEDDDEELMDFLASNKHRQKNFRIMLDETLHLMALSQKSGQVSNGAADETLLDESVPERDDVFQGLSLEEAANKLGTSASFVMRVRVVFSDEYRDKYFEELAAAGVKLSKAGKTAFLKEWNKVRTNVRNEKVTLTEAAEALRGAKSDAMGTKKGKSTKAKAPVAKPKAEPSESFNTRDNVLTFLVDAGFDPAYQFSHEEVTDLLLLYGAELL